MRIALVLLHAILAVACGRDPASPSQHDRLQDEYDRRLAALHAATADHVAGWPDDQNCDGALWAGMARRAGADWVDVAAALGPDGRPTRRPHADCLPVTTSNDMLLGTTLGLNAAGDVTALQRLYDYGVTNDWIMGTPIYRVDLVLARPNQVALLKRALGTDTIIPVVYAPGPEDFEIQLQLLSMLLQRDLGDVGYLAEAVVQATCLANPDDALAQVVCGHADRAAALLLGDAGSPYTPPHYVRDGALYPDVHWLLAARVVLESRGGTNE